MTTRKCCSQLRKGVGRHDGLQGLQKRCHTQSYNSSNDFLYLPVTRYFWTSISVMDAAHLCRHGGYLRVKTAPGVKVDDPLCRPHMNCRL